MRRCNEITRHSIEKLPTRTLGGLTLTSSLTLLLRPTLLRLSRGALFGSQLCRIASSFMRPLGFLNFATWLLFLIRLLRRDEQRSFLLRPCFTIEDDSYTFLYFYVLLLVFFSFLFFSLVKEGAQKFKIKNCLVGFGLKRKSKLHEGRSSILLRRACQ